MVAMNCNHVNNSAGVEEVERPRMTWEGEVVEGAEAGSPISVSSYQITHYWRGEDACLALCVEDEGCGGVSEKSCDCRDYGARKRALKIYSSVLQSSFDVSLHCL